MIVKMLGWQGKMSAQDRGANFRDEFFRGQSMSAESLRHVAADTMGGAGRMNSFVVERRRIILA